MGKQAEISLGNRRATIEFLEAKAPQSVEKIWNLLPLEIPLHHAKFAGDELMFMIPLVMEAEQSKDRLESEDIVYYPIQQTLCLFFSERIQPFGSGSINAVARIAQGFKDSKEHCAGYPSQWISVGTFL
jgi:hypothetical protein